MRRLHGRHARRKLAFMFLVAAAIAALVGLVITLGPLNISFVQVYEVLLSRVFPQVFHAGDQAFQIVWNIRLPRLMGAVMAGVGLGVCGCVMQSVLMNPLASPFTLGISAGAQFGVAVAAFFGAGVFGGPYLLIGNAFVFALLCSFFIVGLSLYRGATSETLVLAGIVVNYFFSSLSRLFKYFASDEQLRLMVSWGMGDLSAFSWNRFPVLMGVFLLIIPFLWLKGRDLNIMTVGDESAKSLGVNANRVRISSMAAASLLVATVVCFTGPISFIGLVAPHMARILIGADHKFLIPASGLLGALVLLGADAVGMNIVAPTIIPTGIMTSLIGAPFFAWLILKGKKREYWT